MHSPFSLADALLNLTAITRDDKLLKLLACNFMKILRPTNDVMLTIINDTVSMIAYLTSTVNFRVYTKIHLS
jgi:hypothetical protein